MRVNIEQAAAFVRRRGLRADIVRLGYALSDERVSDTARSEALTGQHADGGWAPFWASDYRSLDATCFRLAQAEQMGIGASDPDIARAVAFLIGRQQPSGHWQENATVAQLAPPWAAPGNEESRAYLTANCGFWVAALGATPEARYAARHASDALAAGITPEGFVPGFAHTTWLAVGLFRLTGSDDLAMLTERWLEQRVRNGLPASSLTWLLSALRVAGFSPTSALARTAGSQLATQQRIDGGWTSEDGLERETHVTLEAIRALLWLDLGP
jgi:hypothetical protein